MKNINAENGMKKILNTKQLQQPIFSKNVQIKTNFLLRMHFNYTTNETLTTTAYASLLKQTSVKVSAKQIKKKQNGTHFNFKSMYGKNQNFVLQMRLTFTRNHTVTKTENAYS